MKTKKLTALVAAALATFAIGSTSANAGSINMLNVDTLGGSNTFINVAKLNSNVLDNGGFYNTYVNLGSDNILSNGDTFTESLVLYTTSSNNSLGNPSFGLAGDYKIVANLNGTIQNVTGPGQIGVAPGNLGYAIGGGVTFTVSFDNSPASLLELWDNINNVDITAMTLTAGGSGPIQLVSGQLIGTITLNALLGPCVSSATCDTYITSGGGTSIDGQDIPTITTGSARFMGFDGSVYNPNGGSTLAVNFFDNGQATTIPEPATLLLMGSALVGLGAVSRRRKQSV